MTDSTAGVVIESDLMTKPLVDLWNVLLDLSERVPQAWSLIGGQMVLLHGLEHGRTPPAASADLDVLADVLSDQRSLSRLVTALAVWASLLRGCHRRATCCTATRGVPRRGSWWWMCWPLTIWDLGRT